MRLLPLGIGDAFSALWYSTSLLLEHQGHQLLIDCPHPLRKMLREADPSLQLDQLGAVLITHNHADHVSGLEPVGFFFRFALQRRLPLICHPAVRAALWEGHLRAGMGQLVLAPGRAPKAMRFEDYFEWIPLDEATSHGPFQIEARLTRHHIPTTALRVHAGHHHLGLSADTAEDPSLLEWLAQGTQLIVHESNLGPSHTPIEALIRAPQPLRERLRLIHLPDSHDRAHSPLPCLAQGRWVQLPDS